MRSFASRSRLGPAVALGLLVLLRPAAAAEQVDELAPYRDAVSRLVGAAITSDHAYETLRELCDRFGHRLAGTPQLEACIDWCAERMTSWGLSNVAKEPVTVPVWVRGDESARLTAPLSHRLNILGLGQSVGTPPEGIEADVVVVGSFDELDALVDDAVSGKIVLYDVPFTSYGETVRYRGAGASRAAARGAVAALVRSVGPMSFDTPHTGSLRYSDDAPKIPAAAVTIENATLMHRLQDRGLTPRVRLRMEAHTLDDAISHNVVAELPGRELPEEIIVVGGHIDSWDVGQGAQDDGVGCVIAMEVVRLMRELGLRPRRTIRVVLFTNEENGLKGALTYRDHHLADLPRHVAAIESDSGNGLASGFRVDVRPRTVGLDPDANEDPTFLQAREGVLERLRALAPLLEPLGAGEFFPEGSGADVGPLVDHGVVGLGMQHDTTRYWEVHHTWADTFEKIVKADLDQNVAILAVLAYALAEMPERLLPPSPAADLASP